MLEVLKNLKNQKGMSLVSVLLALGLVSGGFYVVNSGLVSMLKVKDFLHSKGGIGQFRANLVSNLGNGLAFRNTLSANPTMSCVGTGDCSSKKGTDWAVDVMDSKGIKLVDASNEHFGFKADGSTCSNFDAVSGSDSCPYQFKVLWSPICPASGACKNPQNRFKGVLTEKRASAGKIQNNVTKYNFQIFPAKFDDTLEAACTALSGGFNSGSGQCSLPMEGLCPSGQVVKSVAPSNNSKVCGLLAIGICAPGEAIQSVQPDGSVKCKTISFCPASTSFKTWIPFAASVSGDGGDGGDGCDGADGCDGGS